MSSRLNDLFSAWSEASRLAFEAERNVLLRKLKANRLHATPSPEELSEAESLRVLAESLHEDLRREVHALECSPKAHPQKVAGHRPSD